MDNYRIQLQQAQRLFLQYDQQEILEKFRLKADDAYFYPVMLGQVYRLNRKTGSLERQENGTWQDANTHSEVMTLLDWLCDSKPNRCISGKWKSMPAFGNHVHQSTLADAPSPLAEVCGENLPEFNRACRALGGEKVAMGDSAWAIELFDGLKILSCLWLADEDFPAQLRYYWDENALEYIKYETMYYALDLLNAKIQGQMKRPE